MRLHIYSHEPPDPDRVALTSKEAKGTHFTGVQIFFGERFIHSEGDDDSSAVTFWFHSDGQDGKNEKEQIKKSLLQALRLLELDGTNDV